MSDRMNRARILPHPAQTRMGWVSGDEAYSHDSLSYRGAREKCAPYRLGWREAE
jgi:hypothetical protein